MLCHAIQTLCHLGVQSYYTLDLEKGLDKVYLPTNDGKNDDGLYDGPPLDAIVCRLGRVAMHFFAHDDVLLLIFYTLETVGKIANFALKRRNG